MPQTFTQPAPQDDILVQIQSEALILLQDCESENTFDVAIARFVFQHLPEPIAAAQAIWHLLKPGGKLVIIDPDDELYGIVQPPVPELASILEKYGEVQARRGGNRQIGRLLWRILAQAGFLPCALETIAFHSDELGMEAFREHLDPERFVPLVKAGSLSEQTFTKTCLSCEAFLASPEPFILILWLMACGQKPEVAEEKIE